MRFRRLIGSGACAAALMLPVMALAQDADAGRTKAQVCMGCHGPGGNSPQGTYPNLAGQNWRYIYLQLRDFKEGRRSDPVMSGMAASLSRQDMMDLAYFFAAEPARSGDFRSDETRAAKGKAKTDETLCTMCHQEGFSGQNEIPRVAGQKYDYIVKQLSDFKARRRTNDAGNMTSVAQTLSEEDIQNIANYIAGLR